MRARAKRSLAAAANSSSLLPVRRRASTCPSPTPPAAGRRAPGVLKSQDPAGAAARPDLLPPLQSTSASHPRVLQNHQLARTLKERGSPGRTRLSVPTEYTKRLSL